jgi:hypothetical protein
MHPVTSDKRPHYSALFTLLECLDLEEVKDVGIERAIVNVTRKLACTGYGPTARLSMQAIMLLRLHSGISFDGEADTNGWKKLVITTSRHSIEITP